MMRIIHDQDCVLLGRGRRVFAQQFQATFRCNCGICPPYYY
jgi:hypothetical protein